MKTAPPDASKHKVLNIIDGDTIDIETTTGFLRVRIIGIDTPETVHPGEPVEPGGPEATARARQLLGGKTITIHYDPNPDHGLWGKYGRLLTYLELPDGRDYSLVMIQEGFSKAYIKYPFSRQAAYLRAEQKTRQPKNRKRGSDMNAWIMVLIRQILRAASAPLKKTLEEFAKSFRDQARKTTNPWDDILADSICWILQVD
ncbi:hypothetical protein ES703_22725 [subsurface metagenome]